MSSGSAVSILMLFLVATRYRCVAAVAAAAAAGIGSASGGRPLTHRDVVRSSGPLSVLSGRDTVIVPRRDIDIYVRPGDRCTFTLPHTETLPYRVGRLRPATFPCDFAEGDVIYTHYGSARPSWDRIHALVKYDTRSQTSVIPMTIEVNVDFSVPYEVVRLGKPLEVRDQLGYSNAIDSEVVQFNYNRAKEDCRVSFLNGANTWPMHGSIANDSSATNNIECDDFLLSNLRYKSTTPSAINKDRLLATVTVQDRHSEESVQRTEHFELLVHMLFAAPNEPPLLSLSALMSLDVNQFIMTALTTEVLLADDKETPARLIIFNLTRTLGPEEGQIVCIDDSELPLKSFYQEDIQLLKIAYKPPAGDSDVPRYIKIPIQAIDSEGLASEAYDLVITVNPMNTLAPLVTRNLGITLVEGESRQLSSSQCLQVSDEDNIQDVRIQPLYGPTHGRLYVSSAPGRGYFTSADLDSGAVWYEHDGSDSVSDNIIFSMTDGRHEVQFLFPIAIYPQDDTSPRLTANAGLQTFEGTTQQISIHQLSAFDADGESSEAIAYELQQPYSSAGHMVLRIQSEPADPRGWTRGRHFWERRVVEWTQLDILKGHLHYKHVGAHVRDVTLDVVRFRLRDGAEPPNESQVHEFLVHILPQDLVPPERCSQDLILMKANESDMTVFTRKHLCYTDDDSDDRHLVYTITRAPYTAGNTEEKDYGQIVFTDTPGTVASMFKQSHINHGKIAYLPPSEEVGIIPRIVEFIYTVADPSGNEQASQLHRMLLQPIDNKPPRVLNTGVTVYENGFAIIIPTLLYAEDADTPAEQLAFKIVALPSHGTLQLLGQPMYKDYIFRRKDIESGSITYIHSGSESHEDSFGIEVTDGTHVVPVHFRVTVIAVDDEAPYLAKQGSSLRINVDEGGITLLGPSLLSARDNDTDEAQLTFIIEKPPQQGHVIVDRKRSEAFTQAEIHRHVVFYRHDGSEVGREAAQDSFVLKLSDMSEDLNPGGNVLSSIRVEVTIGPVDNRSPMVITGATTFTVAEGSFATITSSHLSVADVDSAADAIVCTIVTAPRFGYVEVVNPTPGSEILRKGIPASAFYWQGVKDGTVNYVQSVHRGVEPSEDNFGITCSDGVNVSPEHRFDIVIQPVCDESPVMHVREFVVQEGFRLTIDTPLLNAEDGDVPQDQLHFKIIVFPLHGKFVSDHGGETMEVSRFTLAEIYDDSRIFYEHDNTETLEDSFTLELTDGVHTVSQKINIVVVPVDDETPRLTVNNGLDLERPLPGSVELQWKFITNRDLMAEDVDSDSKNITFRIRQQAVFGILQRYNLANKDWDNITKGLTFQQWEIDNRNIRYVHAGRQGVRDLIKFDISDPAMNKLVDRYFYINVEGIDQSYPDVISKGIELPQSNSIVITTDVLSAADDNSPVEYLRYTVTKAPSQGYLELTDFPGRPVTDFTQLQLAGSKLRYVHDSNDEVLADHFEFEVTDGFNPVNRAFKITLLPVNNKLPTLLITRVRVHEGNIKVITPFEIDMVDKDTGSESLVFVITQLPKHGSIKVNGSTIVRSFTVADVHGGRVAYHHDGTETTSDHFYVRVSDGSHDSFYTSNTAQPTRSPQKVLVEVIPVDNSFPQLVINAGPSDLQRLPIEASAVNAAVGFCFSDRMLKTNDADTDAAHLTYRVLSGPQFGRLVHVKDNSKHINTWTQEDVNMAQIYYILKDGIKETHDSFNFTVVDRGGNTVGKQTFSVRWSFVRFTHKDYMCNEADKRVVIKLVRRGHLDETSFVALRTRDSTARAGSDFVQRHATQVQFSPGEAEKNHIIPIIDDTRYEDMEQFYVELYDPVSTIIEGPLRASVTIRDPEDEATVFFEKAEVVVNEWSAAVQLSVHRSADTSAELMVICATKGETATGSVPGTLITGTDFITRAADFNSVLRFDTNETQKMCIIKIIDDALYESHESFTVHLLSPLGGRIGNPNATRVTILSDSHDSPLISFASSHYEAEESQSRLTVRLIRAGTDLAHTSSVTVVSRRTDPASAQYGLDYEAVRKTVDFAKGDVSKEVSVYIIDDADDPELEGQESFRLILLDPVNATLAHPSSCLVNINDESDLPSFEFAAATYAMAEDGGMVATIVRRSGDTSLASTVRCYTRQNTARAGVDYMERPDSDASVIYFAGGEMEKPCTVVLLDDARYEESHDFQVVLGSPRLADNGRAALIGDRSAATIVIKDDTDRPTIKFDKATYEVREPRFPTDIQKAKVTVIRSGDLMHESIVSLYTRDGSAKAGQDYAGYSAELEFGRNVSRRHVEIEILYDIEREPREFFSLLLKEDRSASTVVERGRATIYIEERNPVARVTFPSSPVVVSLKDYDDVDAGKLKAPVPGFPVVCLTPCHPNHPDFSAAAALCSKEQIDHAATRYRWLVSAAADSSSAKPDLQPLDADTFFVSTKERALDSIYFRAGSQVQCKAQAVSTEGDIGLERASTIVTIGRADDGPCPSKQVDDLGAEPFLARMRYTGASDAVRANAMRISVTIPHRDGMLPVLSTHKLSNFEFALSKDSSRVAQHRCSNLVDDQEVESASAGFLMTAGKRPGSRVFPETLPHQYDANIRGHRALMFYRNLDLNSCQWDFVAFYNMSELTRECGAKIETDGQVHNATQSVVTIVMPLYVSYVSYSKKAISGWQSVDLSTNLRVTFVYDTSILWHKGITNVPADNKAGLQGTVHPTSMRMQNDGKLAVKFKSQATFRGLFVVEHGSTGMVSSVHSLDLPALKLKLSLLRTQPTFDQPEQLWEFVSELSVRDYSGVYQISLIPCTVRARQKYSSSAPCAPQQPITFNLHIRLQQVSDAVPAEYTLNTGFRVMRKRNQWLTAAVNSSSVVADEDLSFGINEKMYGKVSIDKAQSVGHTLHVTVEKVFICAGKDGYVPKYDPGNNEYGCSAPSASLQYQFKVIDRNDPNTAVVEARGVPFNALLAMDDVTATALSQSPDSDGFSVDCRPLFEVDPARSWFVHVVYTIRSQENSYRSARRRKAAQEHDQLLTSHTVPSKKGLQTRMSNAAGSQNGVNTGVNMARLYLLPELKRPVKAELSQSSGDPLAFEEPTTPAPLVLMACGIAAGLLIAVMLAVFVVRLRRQRAQHLRGRGAHTVIVQSG